MASGLKSPRGGLASSVELVTAMLSWNFPQWRNFVKDMFTALLSEGRAYTSIFLDEARERHGVAPRTVQRWIKRLVDLGVLEKHREGKVGEEGGRWYYTVSPLFFTSMERLASELKKRYNP